MTQLALVAGGVLVGRCALETDARAHARRHGLTFLRVELDRGLFGPVEVAVLRRADGGLVRRTAQMIEQAKGA